MTAEQIPEAPRIGGAATTRDTTHDRYPFYLGDDDTILTGTRPKMAVLLRLVAGMDDENNVLALAQSFNEFLDKVLDGPSVAYVRARMEDDEDDLDLDHPDVKAMFQHLVEVWYGTRPPRGRSGSSGPSSKTGRRSTARARSGG